MLVILSDYIHELTYTTLLVLLWHSHCSKCNLFVLPTRTLPLDSRERARTKVEVLMQCAAEYDYQRDHVYMKRVMSYKMDYVLEVNIPLALLVQWWMDEQGTANNLTVWEEGELRAITEGDVPQMEFRNVFPVLRVIPALDCVWRVLGAAGISWQNVEHMKTEVPLQWTLPDASAFLLNPQYLIMKAKVECFLCGPDRVETSEVLDYLPRSDSCHLVRDRNNHMFGCSVVEPLEVRISQAALLCGNSRECLDLATSHAKAAAASHRSPQSVMFAQAAAGIALMKCGGKSYTIEAHAVLDSAVVDAKKMRLMRHAEVFMENK